MPEAAVHDIEAQRGEIVAASVSTAIVAGHTPQERIARATEIATQLDHVIKTQGLRTKIGRRKVVRADGREEWVDNFHIDVEAWQTLAAFLELAVVPVWTRRVIDPTTGEPERVRYTVQRTFYKRCTTAKQIKDGTAVVERVETAEVDGYSWEARVEVTKNGALISAGDAMVSRTEERWRDDDDHALRSMAQTRAIGRAVSVVARWIITLAGYTGTPDTPPDGAAPGPGFAEASDDLRDVARGALGYLLRGDSTAVEAAEGKLAAQYGGQLPAVALQAVVIAAQAVKAQESADG